MKSVMLVLVVIVSFFVLGCQSDNVNPTSSTSQFQTLGRVQPIGQPVHFSEVVFNPLKFPEEFIIVDGQVDFQLQTNPMFHSEVYELRCNITTAARYPKGEELIGTSYSKTYDELFIDAHGKDVTVTKSLALQGSQLPLIVNLDLRVTPTTVQVQKVWLSIERPVKSAL